MPGWFVVAVPLTMSEERVGEIQASCPEDIELQTHCHCCGRYALSEEFCRATEYAVNEALRPMKVTKKSKRHSKRRER